VAGHGDDPFAALFQDDTAGGAAWRGEGPDDFRTRPHVTSHDGQAIGRLLASLPGPADPSVPAASPVTPNPSGPAAPEPDDDADMVLIVDDADDPEPVAGRVAAVRPDDYRSLFTRLRRGDGR